jgi:hypothetical protein
VMLQVKYIRDGSTPEVRAWAAWTRGGFFWWEKVAPRISYFLLDLFILSGNCNFRKKKV